jgi:excisionase family DNA binding protein
MDNQNVTITTEELKELIENAVYKAINGQTVNYELITEKKLSKWIGISKVTLHKLRKEGKIPFSKIGRSIRYDYKEVQKAIKIKL